MWYVHIHMVVCTGICHIPKIHKGPDDVHATLSVYPPLVGRRIKHVAKFDGFEVLL